MPTVKFGLGNKSNAEAGQRYTGKRPPHKTIYRVRVKRLGMKVNNSDDFMLNAVLEINEPEGSPKAKYNGYGFWWNGNVTDQGAGYVNQFLDSLTGGKKAIKDAFWGGKCVTEDKPKKGQVTPIKAIGAFKVDQDGMDAIVYAELGKPYQGDRQLAVGRWLMTSDVPDDADDNEGIEAEDGDDDVDVEVDGDDDSADEDVDVDGDEDVDVDEDADSDGDDDDDDDDDGEPPF